MVENFILVHFEKKVKNAIDIWSEDNLFLEKNRFEIQAKFFHHMIKQIRFFYRYSNIHIICKDKSHPLLQNKSLILHEFPDMPTTNLSKLNAFGLLNEPAILIDCDIMMLKPFDKHHLETKNPFNLFSTYEPACHRQSPVLHAFR